jgi:hypothetical protein
MKKSKKIGRPREDMPVLPLFENMQACAAVTGISIGKQRLAKRAGCPAFKSNRVCLATLLRWLFATDDGDESRIDWDRLWRKYRAQREQINLMKDRGEVATRVWFGELLATVGKQQRDILERHVSVEVLAEICGKMQALSDTFPTDGGLPK